MSMSTFDMELRTALQVQHDLLGRIRRSMDDVEQRFEDNADTSVALRDLEALMDDIEQDAEYLRFDDLADFDSDAISRIYDEHRAALQVDLEQLDYKNWQNFVHQTRQYIFEHDIDPFTPYESLLTENDLKQLREESYDAQYRWTKGDYLFVILAGVTASLVDHFLVMIPQDMNRTDLGVRSKYFGQQGSPITKWMQSYDTHKDGGTVSNFANWLGDLSKVPYDRCDAVVDGQLGRIPGMSPNTHRLQSIGHDPAVGLIAGFFDILRGTMTGFSYDSASGVHSLFSGEVQSYLPARGYGEIGVRLIKALLKPLAHLVSDAGSKAGLPAPFMTLMQGIDAGSFGSHDRSTGEIARYMYQNGYDFRHFLTMGITPAVIEITLRGYIMLRQYAENGDIPSLRGIGSNPKYRSMLVAAHGIACVGNAGKVALLQGNPLAINQAEWVAFFWYLLPHLKYTIFDQHRLRMEHLDSILDNEWDHLLNNGRNILRRLCVKQMDVVMLGQM